MDDHTQMLFARMFEAIYINDIEQVRTCIEQGVDVNEQQFSLRYDNTMCSLALACCRGQDEIMEELLKAGADPNQHSKLLNQLVMLTAARLGGITLAMIKSLLSYGAHSDFRDDVGMNVLHFLARGKFNDTDENLLFAAKLLLDNGASFYARDLYDHTPLYCACRSGNVDIVKLFIAEGADVNFDIGHLTMLRGAADNCDIDLFDLLLDVGANRQLTPEALMRPCYHNNHSLIVKILDTCDIDINMGLGSDHGGITILHYACDDSCITTGTVQLLLDRGADGRTMSDSGDTALHYAMNKPDYSKIHQLLSYNHPPDTKNNRNQTPLVKLAHSLIYYPYPYNFACYQSKVLVFKMLVIAGAKVTADVERELDQLCIKHPETQREDYEISSIKTLKEMCRFVIRGTIHVPVDASMCKLLIPKLLQEYLSFPEFDTLIDEYLKMIAGN